MLTTRIALPTAFVLGLSAMLAAPAPAQAAQMNQVGQLNFFSGLVETVMEQLRGEFKKAVDQGKKAAADYAKDLINKGKSAAWDAYLKKMQDLKERAEGLKSDVAKTLGTSLIDLLIEVVGNLLFGDDGPPDA